MPDIDDWVFQFERAAAPRLKEIFERDMNWTIPEKMIEQLKRASCCGGTASEKRATVAFGSLSLLGLSHLWEGEIPHGLLRARRLTRCLCH